MATAVLEACPTLEWRLIFALVRFGGLRCPSEVMRVKWAEVDWLWNRFLVHAPKTEHHEGKGERWVPIFPELQPLFQEAFEKAEPGTVYMIETRRLDRHDLGEKLNQIIRKAGLTPWPRTFSNLRASRETELAAKYPIHVVCAWLGNSPTIAGKHYLQVTDADFEAAARGGAESDASAVQNPMQHTPATSRDDSQTDKQSLVPCEVVRNAAGHRMPPGFFRNPLARQQLPSTVPNDAAESDALDPELAEVVDAWPLLNEEERAAILEIVRRAVEKE